MIRRLHVQGYRTLRDVDLPLGPLNVLIGPNGCGKTNLLDTFTLFHEYAAGKLEDTIYARGGLDGVLWARQEYESVRILLVFAPTQQDKDSEWEFRLRLRRSGINFVSDTDFGQPDKLTSFEDAPPTLAVPFVGPSRKLRDRITPRDEAERKLKDLFASSVIYTFFDTTHSSLMRQPATSAPPDPLGQRRR